VKFLPVLALAMAHNPTFLSTPNPGHGAVIAGLAIDVGESPEPRTHLKLTAIHPYLLDLDSPLPPYFASDDARSKSMRVTLPGVPHLQLGVHGRGGKNTDAPIEFKVSGTYHVLHPCWRSLPCFACVDDRIARGLHAASQCLFTPYC
jgi:hypothetical protein